MGLDIKKVADNLKKDIEKLSEIEAEDVSKEQALKMIQQEVNIVNSVEKRESEETLQNKEYELKKDHTYFQEGQDKEKLKLERERLDLEKDNSKNSKELGDKKLELERTVHDANVNLDQQKIDLEKQKIDNNKKLEDEKIALEKQRLSIESSQNDIRRAGIDQEFQIEKLKIEYENKRLELEQENVRVQNEIRKDNQKFQMITTVVTAGTALLSFIGSVIGMVMANRAHKRVLTMIYLDEGRSTTELRDSVKRLDNYIKRY